MHTHAHTCTHTHKHSITPSQENVSLLKEINDLRCELKKSCTNAHDLEATLNIARKQGFDEQAALTRTKPLIPPTGLAKVEPSDNSRIVEMQKAEISRLRGNWKGSEDQPQEKGFHPCNLLQLLCSRDLRGGCVVVHSVNVYVASFCISSPLHYTLKTSLSCFY